MESRDTGIEGVFWASVVVPCFKTNSSKGLKVKFKLGAKTEMQKEGAAVQTPRKHPYVPLLTGKHIGLAS